MLFMFGRRLLGAVPVLLALILVVFALQKIAPVDPVAAYVGEKASPEAYEAARHKLWLDQPLPTQLVHYIQHAATGDLGFSTVTRAPVSHDIAKLLPATLELLAVALLFVVVFGFLLGLATAQRWRGSG